MKKLLGTLVLLAAFGMVNLPASAEGVVGLVYKDATEAGVGFSTATASKVGTATAKSFFGVVALGDASINAAAKSAGIKTISYYDTYVKNIVGFKTVTTRVYGN